MDKKLKKAKTTQPRVAAKPSARKEAKPPQAKVGRTPGVKAQVAALLLAGGTYTLEELLKETRATKVTLQTALSDLRSEKYCGPTGRLNIVQVDGKYSLAKEGHT
jgi:hypothetical protein